MSWQMNTGCRYHTQDTSYYCGAAAAMMILAEIGVPYTSLDQINLYASNHSHNLKPTGWYTDPYGLCFTLNDRELGGYYFVVHKPTSEVQGTRDIVHTLWKYGVSPAALVYAGGTGFDHWIAVRGVRTDLEPTPGTSYTVEGLWINNPVWYSPSPPPPHNAADACGSGGALGLGNQFVTYANWRNNYFIGGNYDAPLGSLQYISVCDPDPREIELPGRRPREFRADGRRFILHREAIRFAEESIKEYGLQEDGEAAEALDGAKPGTPQRVLRLDQPDTHYYLVPWMRDGMSTALSQIDALSGEFQSLQLLAKPVRGWLLPRRRVAQRVNNRRFEVLEPAKIDPIVPRPELVERPILAEEHTRVIFRPGAYCLPATLVWRPCRESFSPHLPFYQITMGDHKLYVRIDGEIFTRLTTTGRGV